jgi:predicted nucleotidyltransferase
MKKKLLDISGKIDPEIVAIYELIASEAQEKNIKFFIIGATARDLVFQHGFGTEARRATKDIDLGVQVSSWDEFEGLKNGLVETGRFMRTKSAHRLMYEKLTPVDIVPFGAIKEEDGSISWPPDHEVRMSIVGFEDAYNDAMMVRLKTNPDLDVLVVSPPSLAVLKLIAWKDRASAGYKDAIDLCFIIRGYLDIGNNERLHEEHSDLVGEDFDYVRAGARLLGRDIANILGEKVMEVLLQIIEEQTAEGGKFPLVEDMSRGDPREIFEENLILLKLVKQGILDVVRH